MPFALVFIGLVLVVTGARGTMREFGAELREDFTGSGNFTWWIVSIGTIGALGYVESMKSFSRIFMTLIVLAMILSNRGFFTKFIEAMQQGPTSPTPETTAVPDTPKGVTDNLTSGLSKGVGDALGNVLQTSLKPVTDNSILGNIWKLFGG